VDIDKLEAGRELDALVAEKVMGITVIRSCGEYLFVNPPILTPETVHRYSTDISAAWKVLRCLASLRIGADRHPARDGRTGLYKPVFRIEAYEHDDEYSVVIGRCKCTGMDDDVVCRQMGGDFDSVVPLLICRAALKCVGVNQC